MTLNEFLKEFEAAASSVETTKELLSYKVNSFIIAIKQLSLKQFKKSLQLGQINKYGLDTKI